MRTAARINISPIVIPAIVALLGLLAVRGAIFIDGNTSHEEMIYSAKRHLIEHGFTGPGPTYHLRRVVPCSWRAITGVSFEIYTDSGSWRGAVCWRGGGWHIRGAAPIW